MKQLKQFVVAAKAKMPPEIVKAHKHCGKHRAEVLKSKICACFYCQGHFAPTEIVEWIDKDQTAMCPKCGIDSVLGAKAGFPLTPEFLGEMNKYWF
jgi:hypothetical protein